MPRNLPLENLWKEKGALFREEKGLTLPASFGVPEKEYDAAFRTAALFDLSWRDKLRISGSDRIAFLHNLLTGDIQSLKPGQGCYAAFLTAQGKIIADMKVYLFSDHILLDCEAGLAQKIVERLGRFVIMEDVLMENVPGICHFLITGAQAGEITDKLFGAAVPPKGFEHAGIRIKGVWATIIKSSSPGMDGYEILIEGGDARPAAEELLTYMMPAGHEVWESLRIEAGWPRYGIDMSEEDTLPETGLDAFAASETKGCYPGQEVVARTNTYKGHAKKMFRFFMNSACAATPGDKLLDGEEEAGWITSVSYSNRIKKTVMLGYLKKKYFGTSDTLKIASSHETIDDAIPIALP